jgi:hypothetical protein
MFNEPFGVVPGELRLGASAVTFRFNNRVYWFSWSDRSNAQKSWVDAERVCRQLCMELVSLDTPGETEFVASMIPKGELERFIERWLKCSESFLIVLPFLFWSFKAKFFLLNL